MYFSKEYVLSRQISDYLIYQYHKILFHFDITGVGLSKAQAGMMKYIQKRKGWPDLFIAEPRKGYLGLFIELKVEGTKLFKKDGQPVNDHITEQKEMLFALIGKGYMAEFGIGFDETKKIIDNYLKD
jgi:hypothetical protein